MFSSASDDSDNKAISNVTVGDTPEPEDEEEMEKHGKLYDSKRNVNSSTATSRKL